MIPEARTGRSSRGAGSMLIRLRSNAAVAVMVACAWFIPPVLATMAASCAGSTQTSRASTISSLDTGIQTATAALRTYEHEHTEAIIRSATDVATAKASIAAFRARVDKVWIAVDSARAAIDAANTINDDTSIKGAQTALTNAVAAITAITGGTP